VIHGAPPVLGAADGTLGIVGDQQLWSSTRPQEGSDHNGPAARSRRVEVQQTTFRSRRQGPAWEHVFTRYKIINRGTNTLANAYVSQWSDPDLGGFTDDLVVATPTLSVGFVYNAEQQRRAVRADNGRRPSATTSFRGPRVRRGPGDTVTLGLASSTVRERRRAAGFHGVVQLH